MAVESVEVRKPATPKQLKVFRETPAEVDAVDVRYAGPSRDLHTNTWRWTCGRCYRPAGRIVDTMFRVVDYDCESCGASNHLDFRKYGA